MKLYDWRIWVGWRYVALDHTYTSDWWTLNEAQTTLTATLADGATTASVDTIDTGDWAAIAGAWVGPNGSGQAWEYIEYSGRTSSSLTGLNREDNAVREHNGVHTSGAVVRSWWPISTDNGVLRLSEEMDAAMATITWQAQVSGLRAPQPALREGHAVIVQVRDDVSTAWRTLLLGFLRDVRIRDDGRRLAEWSFTIVSPATMLQSHRAPGLRIGDFSIAAAATVTTSLVLVDARREMNSGDFVNAAPRLSGESITDEDDTTLWISEKVTGPAETQANAPSGYNSFASKIRIHRWPGETDKSRYLEWFMPAGSTQDSWLCSCTNNPNGENQAYVEWNDISCTAGQRVILCEDTETFRRLNPLAEDADLRQIGSAWFDGLDLTADAIAFWDNNISGWSQTVSWGDIDLRPHWENPDSGGDDEGGSKMTGTTPCAAPQAGQVIRYYYNASASQTSDHFATDYLEYAGYLSGSSPVPWAILALPAIGLQLDGDIDDDDPAAGDRLYIADLSGAASTIGLTATGTLQIGLEQITYDDRQVDSVRVVARGANSTTAAAHSAGDLVQVLDGGEATVAPLIARIEWRRTQTPAPTQFIVRTSKSVNVRNPEEDGFADDWTTVATVSGHSALTYGVDLSPARVRHVLIQIERMGTTPARARLNEVTIIVAAGAYDSALAMAEDSADEVIAAVLAGASYNGQLTLDGGQTVDGITTDNQSDAWSVIASMARYTNSLIDVQRDGIVYAGPNPFVADVLTAGTTWTEVNAQAIEAIQELTTMVAQVRVPWRTPDNSESGEERYPSVPNAVGQIVTMEMGIFPDGATAQAAAARAYTMQRYPVTWLVECAEDQPDLRPGAVCRVQWLLDSAMQPANRLLLVQGSDHEISAGQWTTVLRGRQMDRQSVG